jgi:hypothetical protein
MAVLRVVKHVNAAPELVFGVATDLEHLADFIRGVERIERLTDGPMRVGTQFRETRRMLGRECSELFEVMAYDRPHCLVTQATCCGAVFTNEQRFIPDIAGTLVELTLTTKAVSLLARLMQPLGALMMGSMKKCIDADLEDLKAIAEQRAAADWQINPEAALRGYESSMV